MKWIIFWTANVTWKWTWSSQLNEQPKRLKEKLKKLRLDRESNPELCDDRTQLITQNIEQTHSYWLVRVHIQDWIGVVAGLKAGDTLGTVSVMLVKVGHTPETAIMRRKTVNTLISVIKRLRTDHRLETVIIRVNTGHALETVIKRVKKKATQCRRWSCVWKQATPWRR